MKITEILINGLIILLALLGVMFVLNSTVQCDIIITTDYPFCNNQNNYTIKDADFYTIKYVRNLYGYDGQSKWLLDNCGLHKPYLFLIKDIRREKNTMYNDEFRK